jgi:hypothetical protein
MNKLFAALTLCCTPLLAVGCSEQTQQKASEAARQTGEALESATEDVVEGADKLTDQAREALDRDDAADPDDTGADAP